MRYKTTVAASVAAAVIALAAVIPADVAGADGDPFSIRAEYVRNGDDKTIVISGHTPQPGGVYGDAWRISLHGPGGAFVDAWMISPSPDNTFHYELDVSGYEHGRYRVLTGYGPLEWSATFMVDGAPAAATGTGGSGYLDEAGTPGQSVTGIPGGDELLRAFLPVLNMPSWAVWLIVTPLLLVFFVWLLKKRTTMARKRTAHDGAGSTPAVTGSQSRSLQADGTGAPIRGGVRPGSRYLGVGIEETAADRPARIIAQRESGPIPGDIPAVVIDANVALSAMSTDPARQLVVTDRTASRLVIPREVIREIDGVILNRDDGFSTAEFDHRRYAAKNNIQYGKYLKKIEQIHRDASNSITDASEEWIRLKEATLVETGRFSGRDIEGDEMKRAALSVLYDKAANDRKIAAWAAAEAEARGGACLVTDDADLLLFAGQIEEAAEGRLRLIRTPLTL